MARQVIYYTINTFNNYLQELKDNKEHFELTRTTYTRKVKKEEYTILFNQDGKSDFLSLCLINKVRKDARNYIDLSSNDYVKFFDLIEKPNDSVISKIDLRSAYWHYARHIGLITEETHEWWKEKWGGMSYDEGKKARLKALGSLATTRCTVEYENGKRIPDSEKILVEPSKPLYMDVCRGIDDLMTKCANEVEGCVYYYWDCMFINQKFTDEAIDFFAQNDFQVSVDETKLEYQVVAGTGYLVSQVDGNMYMTREENRSHLPDLDKYAWH